MPRPRKPLSQLAPSAFTKNAKRNIEAGRNLTEPEFAVLDLTTPPEMTDGAVAIWLELAPHLEGIVRVTDAPLLGILCELYSEMREDMETVRREGRTVTLPTTGSLAKHPLLDRISDARKQITSISSQFGLSPATRSKIGGVEPEKEKNAFEDI